MELNRGRHDPPLTPPRAGGGLDRQRDEAFDLAKGVGIIAVVGLHLTNRSARLFHEPYSGGWWTLRWINLFLNFCVPLFLVVSAILMARSATRQETPDWKRFASRRLRSVLVPLLVWSAIYWVMRILLKNETRLVDSSYWLDWRVRLVDLFFGKAEFHLYFLSVLVQLCIILPFCVLLFRRVRGSIWLALVISLLAQALAFWLQKLVRFEYPGSTVFWYLASLLPAIWIGMNWRFWPAIRRKTWLAWALFAFAGFAIFGYEAWLELRHLPVNGTLENAGGAIYGLGMPLLVVALLTLWHSGFALARTSLLRLGALSMQIYLMHPIFLEALSRKRFVDLFRMLPVPSLWFFLATLGCTFVAAIVMDKIPSVNLLLFGREVRSS